MPALDPDARPPAQFPRLRIPSVLRITPRELAYLIAAAFFVSALFWPRWPLVPMVGLDPGWKTALGLAGHLGLQWGPDVVFTFGPWSALDNPLAYGSSQVVAASLVWIACSFLLVTLTYALARARRPVPRLRTLVVAVAAVALLITVVGVGSGTALLLIVLVGSALMLVSRSLLVAAIVGVAVGILGDFKLVDAAIGFLVALICAIGARRGRGAAAFLAATGVAFVIAWLLAAQPIGNLAGYIVIVIPVVLGYPIGMASEHPQLVWQYPAAVVLAAAVVAAAWKATSGSTRAVRLATVAAVLVALWLAGHEGFIRHDAPHALRYFGLAVALGLLVLMAQPVGRSVRMAGLATAFGVLVFLVSNSGAVPGSVQQPTGLQVLGATLELISRPDSGAIRLAEARTTVADAYGITPALKAAVGSGPALVDPWDVAAITATDATWEPLPVLQLITEYSPALDRIDADDLLVRPRTVLRSVPYPSIDGRNPEWESPRYQRLLYCRYDVTFTSPGWQVLKPSEASSRCGDVQPGGDEPISVTANQSVAVPTRVGAITLVTITLRPSIVSQVVDFIAKPGMVFVSYGPGRWRLAENPSAEELMLNVPVAHPAFGGLPTAPFASISVNRAADISFSFVPVQSGGG